MRYANSLKFDKATLASFLLGKNTTPSALFKELEVSFGWTQRILVAIKTGKYRKS
jgi:hypothetical protein